MLDGVEVGEAELAAREHDLSRLAEENEARYRELKVLNELSLTILTSPDLESIGRHVLEKCMAIGPFDLGAIYLRDPAAYNAAAEARIVEAALAQAERARARGETARALSAASRVLAWRPDEPDK